MNGSEVGFEGLASAFVSRGGVDQVPEGVSLDLSGIDRAIKSGLPVGGYFVVECWDKDGNLRWEDTAENMVTTLGLNSLLNVYLGDTTQLTAWYIGLIDNSGFTALAAGDTMAGHGGWSEVSGSNFSNSSRPQWTPGSASAGAVVNVASVNYSMIPSGTDTIYGMFLVSDNTKAGTAGVLFATAAFSGGTQATNSGDTLKITYTVSATST